MTLQEIRKRIDTIDAQLLPLFLERMQCSRQVAEVKKENSMPIFNAEREREILDQVQENSGEFGAEARMFYASLMEMSRALQHSMMDCGKELRNQIEAAGFRPEKCGRIACLGEAGSFSHEALCTFYPKAQPLFLPGFGDIFAAVESGEADLGLVPVENSSAGSVGEVYDLILKYRFYIIAAATLPVRDCLAAAKRVDPRTVGTVYSHPQALAQCSEYIQKNSMLPLPMSSTAAAAQSIARRQEAGIGAICSEYAAKEYGLNILERDIQNSSSNCTRFIVISRKLSIPEDARKISLCFSLVHQTGSLYRVLARFAQAGLNLTKIESRPIAEKNFEYDFYLDFTGNMRDEKTLSLILSLHDELPRFSFLGNYTERE